MILLSSNGTFIDRIEIDKIITEHESNADATIRKKQIILTHDSSIHTRYIHTQLGNKFLDTFPDYFRLD